MAKVQRKISYNHKRIKALEVVLVRALQRNTHIYLHMYVYIHIYYIYTHESGFCRETIYSHTHIHIFTQVHI